MPGNWFLALKVPAGAWWSRVTGPPHGVRLFPPEDLHCTVAFLGPVGEQAAMAAFSLAGAWPTGVLQATLGDVVAMGNPRRPSALAALVADGRDELVAAIGSVRDEMLRAAGARGDERPPLPHVTIARPKRSAPRSDVRAAGEWARRLDLGRPLVELTQLVLYTRSADRDVRFFHEHAVQPLADSPR